MTYISEHNGNLNKSTMSHNDWQRVQSIMMSYRLMFFLILSLTYIQYYMHRVLHYKQLVLSTKPWRHHPTAWKDQQSFTFLTFWSTLSHSTTALYQLLNSVTLLTLNSMEIFWWWDRDGEIGMKRLVWRDGDVEINMYILGCRDWDQSPHAEISMGHPAYYSQSGLPHQQTREINTNPAWGGTVALSHAHIQLMCNIRTKQLGYEQAWNKSSYPSADKQVP